VIKIVRKTGSQIHWDEIFEAESLEDFARERNELFKKARPFGDQLPHYLPYRFVPELKCVEHTTPDFKVDAVYRECQTDPFRLK
jgi:hypothetical protein